MNNTLGLVVLGRFYTRMKVYCVTLRIRIMTCMPSALGGIDIMVIRRTGTVVKTSV